MTRRTRGALGLIIVGIGLLLLGRRGGPNARTLLTIGIVLVLIGLSIVRHTGTRHSGV